MAPFRMREPSGLVSRVVAGLATAALLVGCGGGSGSGPGGRALGAYNFTIEDRSVSDQVGLLVANGYRHVSFRWPPQGKIPVEAFLSQPRVADGTLSVLAVLFTLPVDRPHDRQRTADAVARLAGTDVALWLLLPGNATDPVLIERVREVSDLARPHGVSVVLYPHVGHPMADAEDARRIRNAAGREGVSISLHLAHEFKAGNRDRLAEVIRAVVGGVSIATINGTDTRVSPVPDDWSRTILPLDEGDFDVRGRYLSVLRDAGYRGPIVLQTFGIDDPPAEHFRRSAEAWREMVSG